METNDKVMAIAGSFVLVSALLGYFHNHNWLWFTMFVGLNMIQSSFTGFCPLRKMLE